VATRSVNAVRSRRRWPAPTPAGAAAGLLAGRPGARRSRQKHLS